MSCTVRRTIAIASKDCVLLTLAKDDYLRLHERNLLISPEEADVALLKSLMWTRNLTTTMIGRLAVFAKHVPFPAGQIIVREGDGT